MDVVILVIFSTTKSTLTTLYYTRIKKISDYGFKETKPKITFPVSAGLEPVHSHNENHIYRQFSTNNKIKKNN